MTSKNTTFLRGALLIIALFVLGGNAVYAQNTTPFVTTWEVAEGSLGITIPTTGSGYSYTVDWGDGGTDTTIHTGDASHTYTTAGTYTVSIVGTFPSIYFNASVDFTNSRKIKTIKQWGSNPWESMNSAFQGCENLTIEATAGNPDLSNVTNMHSMFRDATAFNQDIGGWDVSNVTNMSFMFGSADAFNQSIGGWGDKTSNVTDMSGMFIYADAFNQPLGGWDVSNVTDMGGMFAEATAFNQSLIRWDVSNVTNMSLMFAYADAFNGDLNGWNVSNVTNMSEMFREADAFNQDIGGWDVSKVTDMNNMFSGATLSTANYDALLRGWSALPSLQMDVPFSGGNSKYCAESARNILDTTYDWSITDGGQDTDLDCTKAHQATFAFASARITKVFGDAAFILLPTGGSGTGGITYLSTDPAVATIDADSGEVTLVGSGTTTITATKAGDVDYNHATASYTLSVVGIILTPTPLTLSEGTTATYTAALTALPTATVTVTITSDNPEVTLPQTTLIFTVTNWNTAQTVTLTAAEDEDVVDDVATLTHTNSGGNDSGIIATLSVTVTDNDTTRLTTNLNEQILSRAAQAMTTSTSAAVATRVESAADGGRSSGKPLAFQLDGLSSLPGLLEKNGKAMLEDTMDYHRLLEGASFVLPLQATDDATDNPSAGATGKTAVWGSSNFGTLADDADGLDWNGKTQSAHLGIDRRLGKQTLAGLALSWNDASFDYEYDADNSIVGQGEYQYSIVTLNPYFGWGNAGLKLWGTAGYGQGEITIVQESDEEGDNQGDDQGNEELSTDTTQLSLAAGFNHRLTDSPGRSLHIKGDIALTQIAVESDAGNFAEQDVGSQRVRLLLSNERRSELASGGVLTPSVEAGMRFDGGDGTTGTGVEISGGLRYANPGGNLTVAGNIRALLAGEYDESGVDFSVRLSSQSGRGLSFSVRPVWGRTGSAAERLWNEGASEITGGDTALVGSVDTEVGYGIAATILGAPGILTPYTGMTVEHRTSRLRLGGRFADGNGLSMNLEGTQKSTSDSVSHTVLLRGEIAF